MADKNYTGEAIAAIDEWLEAYKNDPAARHIKRMFLESKQHLSRFDMNANPGKISPGVAAARQASMNSQEKKEDLAPPTGSPQAMKVPEGRSVDAQPKSFEDAAHEAHQKFLEATGVKNNE